MDIGAKSRLVRMLTSPPRRRGVLAVGALAIMSMLLFSRTLFLDRAICCDDLLFFSYPYQHLWAETVRHGELPLWIPYLSGGRPWLADASVSPLYPTMLLNLILPVHKALAVDLLLHVWVAAVFTYLFLRRGHISHVAALLGASVFAFGGFVVAQTQHVSLIRSLAWLPWTLLLTRGIVDRPWTYTAPRLAVPVALSVLAGHLQIVALNLSFAGLLGIYCAATTGERPIDKVRAVVRALTIMGSGGLLGALISAVVLIPAFEMVRLSIRAGGLKFSDAADFSVPPRQMLMLTVPNLFGTPANGSYVGVPHYTEMIGNGSIIALVLAAFGLCRARWPERSFFAVVAVLALVLVMGHHTPVYRWLLTVNPVLRYFRVPARFFLWSSLALAVLTAYGIEWISEQQPDARVQRCWRLVRSGLIFATIIGLYAAVQGPGVERTVRWLHGPFVSRGRVSPEVADAAIAAALRDIRRVGFLIAAATLIVLMAKSQRIGRSFAVGSLGLLLLGELYVFGVNLYPTTVIGAVPKTEHRSMLQDEAYRIATTPLFDTKISYGYVNVTSYRPPAHGLGELLEARVRNMSIVDRVSDVSSYNAIGLRYNDEFAAWMWRDFEDNGGWSPLLDFFGGRYIYDCRPNRWYRRVIDENPCIWMNPNAMPRGWLVSRYERVQDVQEMEHSLRGTKGPSFTVFKPANTVFLYDIPRETFSLQAREDIGRIISRVYRLNRVSFDLALKGAAVLVLNDVHYPGWRAYVDGHEVPIYRANHAFRAVFLPGEARHVDFLFQPKSTLVGVIVSLATLLVVVLWYRAPSSSYEHVDIAIRRY